FDIDANGIVNVSAKDRGTGKEQSMTISGGSALPKDEIDRMVREAEQHAEEDKLRREEAEARNNAEQLVYSTDKFLAENGDKVPEDTKKPVEEALTDLKVALGKTGDEAASPEDLNTKVAKLNEVSQAMGAAIYAAAQAEGGDQAGEPGPFPGAEDFGAGQAGPQDATAQPGDDDVVDAEVVEDDDKK
ncbi:MAG: Hsp70 family protein, partial [Propionibacteriaceae bacterium]|nr:Hsp70 family protein [Propionibacteriaceae bacterium]